MNNLDKFYKYSGVDFYQDYILPTNPSSKNEFFIYFYRNSIQKIIKKNDLKKRLDFADQAFIIHCIALVGYIGVTQIMIDSGNCGLYDNKVFYISLLLNLLINVYPILVQTKIKGKIDKILKKRYNKS